MEIVISDVQIDFDRMTARQGADLRRLTRQTAGVLKALIDADGQVVSKDDLIRLVWDGRIITDATLSTAMKEARRAVGDSGASQKVIETVHGVGFRLVAGVQSPVATPERAVNEPTLLILPFRSLSPADEDKQIADGFTEEVTSSLTRFRNIRVLSRLTAQHFQHSAPSQAAIARDFGVDFVVEGSLRRSAERLRVTVQVSDIATGEIALMEQFDRAGGIHDIFDIQDEIGLLIAGRVATRHGEIDVRHRLRTLDGQTQTWDVYAAVAKFYEFYKTYDSDLHLELRTQLPELLKSDPHASDGWAALALISLEEKRFHLNERSGSDTLAQGLKAAQRAVQCDPQSGFACMTLALCQFHTNDLSGFRETSATALKLNPGHADILAEIGQCHAFLGEFDRAIPLLDQAIELSPVHPGWYHYPHAWRLALGSYWQAALLEIEKVPMPGFFWYHVHQAWFHAELGNTDAAAAARQEILRIRPDFETTVQNEIVFGYYTGPLVQKAFDGWKKAGLQVNLTPDLAARQRPRED